jgi:hypothetical protein
MYIAKCFKHSMCSLRWRLNDNLLHRRRHSYKITTLRQSCNLNLPYNAKTILRPKVLLSINTHFHCSDSVVGTVTKLWIEYSGVRVPVGERYFSLAPKRPYRHSDPASLQVNRYYRLFPCDKAAGALESTFTYN